MTFTNADSGTVVECAYDSMSRRSYKKVTTNGSVTFHRRFIYRGYLQIACIDLTRSNHPALWFITWDPTQPVATRPLAIRKDGSWFTYGWDLTKNICELYSTGGTLTTAYSYSPFGKVTATGSLTQPIQWSSEVWDSELGLVYYNWRYYNPVFAVLNSMDLIFNLNPYIMCNNSPLMNIDSLGLERFIFNASNCTLTLELEFEIDYEDEINFGYGDEYKRHDYISGKWKNEQEKRDYENATKNAIMDYWNNHPYIIKPNKECCPCFKTGIKPQLELLLDQYFNADIKIYVVKQNTEHDELDGKAVREYNSSSGMRLRSNTSSRTINHEFGHAMGLSHPGKGLKKVNIPEEAKKRRAKGAFDKIGPNELSEYYHTGKDINGNEVHYNDLMGVGENKRPFYYDKWKEYLNSYLRQENNMCEYTIK